MRIIFMGTPDFAVPSLQILHESVHEVVAVVTATDKYGCTAPYCLGTEELLPSTGPLQMAMTSQV